METVLLFSAVSFVCWPSCCCGAGGRDADEARRLDSGACLLQDSMTPADSCFSSSEVSHFIPRRCPESIPTYSPMPTPEQLSRGGSGTLQNLKATVVGETLAKLLSVSHGTKLGPRCCPVWRSGEGQEPHAFSLHCPSSEDSDHTDASQNLL